MSRRLVALFVAVLAVASLGGAAYVHAHRASPAENAGDTDRMSDDDTHKLLQDIGYVK